MLSTMTISNSLAPSFLRCAATSRYSGGDCSLEVRELDHDEAVKFLRALKHLEFAATRQNLAAELLEDVRYELGVLLVLIGIVDLRAR